MKKLFIILIAVFHSLLLIGQSDCGTTVSGTLTSYKEYVLGGKVSSYTFDSELSLQSTVFANSTVYNICSPYFEMIELGCGDYSNDDIEETFNPNATNLNVCIGENMCYYHLTNFYNFIRGINSSISLGNTRIDTDRSLLGTREC